MPVNPNLKDTENIQFGRVSDASGNRTSGPASPDFGLEPLLDEMGRLIVRLADKNGFLENSTVKFNSTTYVQTFYAGGPLYLYLLTGINIAGATRYLQLFNSLAVPLVGAIPDFSLLVTTATNFSYQPARPYFFPNLQIVSSLAGDTYQPSGTNDFWLNIESAP